MFLIYIIYKETSLYISMMSLKEHTKPMAKPRAEVPFPETLSNINSIQQNPTKSL